MKIRVLLTGRGYDAASSLPSELELPAGATLSQALARLQSLMNGGHALPESCLLVVGGQHVGTLRKYVAAPLSDGDELTLIAPVAGG